MTRINVIDPVLLSDKHLGAEYRELPRIFGLVKRAIERGEHPNDSRNPNKYVLGEGHVRFFYPRLGYLLSRYINICNECKNRGRKVTFEDTKQLVSGISEDWFGNWSPSKADEDLNISRINIRGGLRQFA